MTQWALESKKKRNEKKCFPIPTKCTFVLVLSVLKQNQTNLYSFDREKKKDFFLMMQINHETYISHYTVIMSIYLCVYVLEDE